MEGSSNRKTRTKDRGCDTLSQSVAPSPGLLLLNDWANVIPSGDSYLFPLLTL